MNFRTLDVPVEIDAARQQITERVDGLRVEIEPDRVVFRAPSGLHLATLTAITLPGGEPGSRLRYRTAIVSSTAAHGRRLAAEIRSAIDAL